jgi:NAD(P)H-quinone oxidoreductase subunit 4
VIEFAVAGLSDPVQATVPWLSLSILVPIGGALLIPFIPDQGEGKQIRWYALIVTLITFLITVAGYLTGYDPSLSGLQLFERVSWLPEIGLTWTVGADGLSMPLILLTSFITSLACLAAWPVTFKPRLFFFLLLAMDGGQIAVFAVQDMLLFFLAWELELLPVYLLLAIWGGKKRQYAATKFILYTAGSSLFILLAALAMGFFGGGTPSFEYTALAAKDFGSGFQLLCYAGLLIAFGVKLPIVPVAHLATGCPWRSHSARAHAAGWHPSEDGWLRPTAVQL